MNRRSTRDLDALLRRYGAADTSLFLAVEPPPLDVVLMELPVLTQSVPAIVPLQRFVLRAVDVLCRPATGDVAGFLRLPQRVAEAALASLRRMGLLAIDGAGRWTIVGEGIGSVDGTVIDGLLRRETRLLCWWPAGSRFLPMRPRMRQRDLVQLSVHCVSDQLAEEYRSAAKADAVSTGLPTDLSLLPLASSAAASNSRPDAPISIEQILVCRCSLQAVALASARHEQGAWTVHSRVWSRPTTADCTGLFASGPEWPGLPLLESLLSQPRCLERLGCLFDPANSADWQHLLEDPGKVQRSLDDGGALLSESDPSYRSHGCWSARPTSLDACVRLLVHRSPGKS